jgi:hypothetical protein
LDLKIGRLPKTTDLRWENLSWEESELPDSDSEENCNCKLLREAEGVDWSTYKHYQNQSQHKKKKKTMKLGMRSEKPKKRRDEPNASIVSHSRVQCQSDGNYIVVSKNDKET